MTTKPVFIVADELKEIAARPPAADPLTAITYNKRVPANCEHGEFVRVLCEFERERGQWVGQAAVLSAHPMRDRRRFRMSRARRAS